MLIYLSLTILKSLHNFRVARLTFDTSIEWCDEKFVFRELFQIANNVILCGWTHHRHYIVLLRSTA